MRRRVAGLVLAISCIFRPALAQNEDAPTADYDVATGVQYRNGFTKAAGTVGTVMAVGSQVP
jgi:hypothetical protein